MEHTIWSVPYWGLMEVFTGLPSLWFVLVWRKRVRRRAPGFEVVFPSTMGATPNPQNDR
jgi:hypothetical protein